MTENGNHSNPFTAQDIERYYAGKMSSQEMHLLEKAALDDPFLADAMDGYRFSQQPAKDMQDLRTSLQARLGPEKIIALPQRNTKQQFLKIAALFLLIAGTGWMVYYFSLTPVDNNVATTIHLPGRQEPEISDTGLNKEVIEKKDVASESEDIKSEVVVKKEAQKNSTSDDKNITSKTEGRTKQVARKANQDAASNAVTISGYNRNRALQEPSMHGDTNTSSMASRLARDTTSEIEGDSVADMAEKPLQTISPGKENVIVLQRSKSDPVPEVVLNKSKTDSANRQPRIVFEEAEPESGTSYYNDYIAQNLRMPDDVNFKAPSGEVKLSFDVNDAGVAVNIKVEKSLCGECDKEAIRILQEGPKLVKKKKDKKGKFSIRF